MSELTGTNPSEITQNDSTNELEENRSNENGNNYDDDVENDDNEEEWDEEADEQEPISCLFCADVNKTVDEAIAHMNIQHSFDLGAIKNRCSLDQYSYIKMINYIRTHKIEAAQMSTVKQSLWEDDVYLKPVVVDFWLMFDIEDFKCSDDTNSFAIKIRNLKSELENKDAIIEQLQFQISQMQKHFQDWVERCESKSADNSTNEVEPFQQTNVAEIPIDDDHSYFASYAHFNIHHEMLSDSIRTDSYRDAILLNRKIFENKIVMDVGCGTSILSMFSAQAGADKVFAIDQSDIIYQGMEIAVKNNVQNIEFVKGRLENVELPLKTPQSVDIIISEWMGYFLLFEGMLDSVIHARDKYLKPGGHILPNRCTISLVGLSDETRHNEHVKFWNDVYGFDMKTLQSDALKEASVEICPAESICTLPVVMSELDMKTVGYDYTNFIYDFELEITKNGQFTAFAGYFDTFFDLPQIISFSTGPHATPTHWKQVVFYVKNPVPVKKGDKICGQFHCHRGNNDARAIRIKIVAFNEEFYFNLD